MQTIRSVKTYEIYVGHEYMYLCNQTKTETSIYTFAAESYGKVRADLEKAGTPIGPLDTMIAAHAKALGYTLVTNNTREFERVKDLKVENWAE